MAHESLFKSPQEALGQIKLHANTSPAMEICGFLGYNEDLEQYIVQLEKNCATDPVNFFAIDAFHYLLFKQHNQFVAVFHSHIAGDSSPSEFDIKMAENCCLPFLIYSLNTKKFDIYEPKHSEYNVNILQGVKEHL